MKLWYISATAIAALSVLISAEEAATVTQENIEKPALRLRGSEESNVHRKLPVTVYDAYDASVDSKSRKQTTSINPGYTGDGGVDMSSENGSYLKWHNVNGGTGGRSTLTVRYSHGKTEDRYQKLYINNSYEGTFTFTSTGSFESFSYKRISGIWLRAGRVNTIKLVNTGGNGGPTYDYVKVDYKLDDPNPKCYEECDFSSECTEGCSLCRWHNSKYRCMPKCGEPCSSDIRCKHAGKCSDCRSGRCLPPPVSCGGFCSSDSECGSSCPDCVNNRCKKKLCTYGSIRTRSEGSFSKGPWWGGHKKGIFSVNRKCSNGWTRYTSGTEVKSRNVDMVACGKFGSKNHDADPSWWATSDRTDCSINIPYCEHHTSSSSCSWVIKEKCTHPYGY